MMYHLGRKGKGRSELSESRLSCTGEFALAPDVFIVADPIRIKVTNKYCTIVNFFLSIRVITRLVISPGEKTRDEINARDLSVPLDRSLVSL